MYYMLMKYDKVWRKDIETPTLIFFIQESTEKKTEKKNQLKINLVLL